MASSSSKYNRLITIYDCTSCIINKYSFFNRYVNYIQSKKMSSNFKWNFKINSIFQESTSELRFHIRKLSFFLLASVQLSQASNVGQQIGLAHGHFQGANLLQLSRARLRGNFPSSSKGPTCQDQGILSWLRFHHQRAKRRLRGIVLEAELFQQVYFVQ